MGLDDLMKILRNTQNIVLHRGKLTPSSSGRATSCQPQPRRLAGRYTTRTRQDADMVEVVGRVASPRTCWACGKSGHIVTNCPTEHARDADDSHRPRRTRNPAPAATPCGKGRGGNGKGTCNFCDQPGHTLITCAV